MGFSTINPASRNTVQRERERVHVVARTNGGYLSCGIHPDVWIGIEKLCKLFTFYLWSW